MTMKTERLTIGPRTFLQRGPTMLVLTPDQEFDYVTLFRVFHNGNEVGRGSLETGDIRYTQGERMAPEVEARVKSMLEEEKPEEFYKAPAVWDEPEQSFGRFPTGSPCATDPNRV